MTSISLSAGVSLGPVHVQADASAKANGPHQQEQETAQQITEDQADLQTQENRAALERKPSGESLGSELETLLATPSPLDRYR